jgi:hypothetical protein
MEIFKEADVYLDERRPLKKVRTKVVSVLS